MYKPILIIGIFVLSAIIFSIGCGKKDDSAIDGKTDSVAAQLITKDSVTGQEKVTLKYIVKKGDKFSYKLIAKTANSEKSPATNDKEMKQENVINYFYTKEVTEVDNSGIITYKTQFDSITINASLEGESISYNSNINDSNKNNPAFFQYNAVINEPFYLRVSPYGEITDVYGLEKVYENLFKSLGDTLKESEKATIKETFGRESIKEIMQQEYQICPKEEVITDSSWVKANSSAILFFETLNNAKYTFKGIEYKDNHAFANIESQLLVEFKNREAKEQGMKVTLVSSETTGTGKIQMDLSRGCVAYKQTDIVIKVQLKLSAGGQTANSDQGVETSLTVMLLN